MIQLEGKPASRQQKVHRLAAVPGKSVTLERRLLERGIAPENILETAAALDRKMVFSIEDLVDNAFRRRENAPTPYKASRFSDGMTSVYYSAFGVVTCKKELGFHLCEEVSDTNLRYYGLIECSYEGITRDLRGLETKHPELVSPTPLGYPFCQKLGERAVEEGVDGYFTASARHSGGTCVPVFSRTALSEFRVAHRYSATVQSGRISFKREP